MLASAVQAKKEKKKKKASRSGPSDGGPGNGIDLAIPLSTREQSVMIRHIRAVVRDGTVLFSKKPRFQEHTQNGHTCCFKGFITRF